MVTALLLIDLQRNMLERPSPVPAAAQVRPALEWLLTRARAAGAAVVHVQNDGGPGDPDEADTDGWDLVFPVASGELVIRKDRPYTFAANDDLAAELSALEVDRVVVAGMQSDYCEAALRCSQQPTSGSADASRHRSLKARGAQ